MQLQRHEPVDDQFCRLIVHNNTVYLAGLVASDLEQGFVGQVRQVLCTLDRLLQAGGTSRAGLLRVMVYLKDVGYYSDFRAEYSRWIDQDNLPARATLGAEMWDERILVEIVATAAIGVNVSPEQTEPT